LYASYYVERPEIPVEVVGRVLPRLENGATAMTERAPGASRGAAEAVSGAAPAAVFGGGGRGPAAAAPAYAAPTDPPPAYASTQPAAVTPAAGTELATQVVLHLRSPVTLADGQEALIPVIDREIAAERVSLHQPDVDARNPLASVELTNDGDTSLPPGV